ncbi:hypothetical protein EB001_03460 [bacterium]|nr:hypothetical protein [bacterium]
MNKFLLTLALVSNMAFAVDNADYNDPNAFKVMGPLLFKDVYTITINGNFDKNSYDKIKEALDKTNHKQTIIYAESFGGYANDITKTASLIHEHGNVTWKVEEGSFCMSACAMVALGSKKIEGILHFHAITFSDNENININLTNKTISELKLYNKDIDLIKVTNSKKLRYVKFS